MPDIAITYRTNGGWGAGKNSRLTKVQVDENMFALATAIMALQDDRPQPAEIASINVSGRFMTITLTNAAVFGPFPLPITEFRFRDEWTPLTVYDPLDWFTVAGAGIFSVMYSHTSGAEFDPNLLVDTLPALKKLFGPDAGSIANSQVYDIEFIYSGRLSDIVDPLNFLALRSITIPSSAVHQAYIAEAPASEAQVLPIMHGAGVIGRATFPVGENVGTVVIDADETFAPGDRLAIGPPVVTDGVAAVMSIAFAAQRVLAS
jgi:hypothetical protein